MNSELIVEECYREAKDNNIDFQLILNGSEIFPSHLTELLAFSCKLLIRVQCLLSIPVRKTLLSK
jgi:hypothetical protein